MVDHLVVVLEVPLLDERVQRDRGVGFRTREEDMSRLAGLRWTAGSFDAACQVDHRLAVDVDGELRPVVEPDLEMTVEEIGDTFAVRVGKP